MKRSILLVEDDVELSEAIMHFLHKRQMHVVHAPSLRDAYHKMRNERFSCIVCDIRLGSESGEELVTYTKTKKAEPNVDVPILIISGFLDRPLVQRLADQIAGAMVKPFEMSVFIKKIESIAR